MLESTKITGVNRPYIPAQFRRACYRYRQPDIDISRPAAPFRASSPCYPQALYAAPSRGLVGPILQLSCAESERPSGSLDILDPGGSPGACCSYGEDIYSYVSVLAWPENRFRSIADQPEARKIGAILRTRGRRSHCLPI